MNRNMPGPGRQPSVGQFMADQAARHAAASSGHGGQPSATGSSAPTLCNCGQFASGRCVACQRFFCSTHAALLSELFTCTMCSQPEAIAQRAALQEARAQEEVARLARIHQAAEAARREEARVAAMPLDALIDYLAQLLANPPEGYGAVRVRPVTGVELVTIHRALKVPMSQHTYPGRFGRRKEQEVGWIIAHVSSPLSNDKFSYHDSTHLLDDGRAVVHKGGPGTSQRMQLEGGAPASTVYGSDYVKYVVQREVRRRS